MSRPYANKLCSYAPRFNKKFNTLGTHFIRNSLCLNVLNDSNSVSSMCMCVEGRWLGVASSIFRRRSVCLKLLHFIQIKAKSEKHIHNMTTIFYLYDCISFNDLPH